MTSQQRKKNSKEYVIEPFEKYIGVEKKTRSEGKNATFNTGSQNKKKPFRINCVIMKMGYVRTYVVF